MKIINPILPIMDTILGDLASLQSEGKITHQTIERVALQWYESERNILRKTTNTGREVAVFLTASGIPDITMVTGADFSGQVGQEAYIRLKPEKIHLFSTETGYAYGDVYV